MFGRVTAALVVSGVLAWLTAVVHAWLGGREILRPSLAAPLGAVVRGTLHSAWHLLTWQFVVLGAAAIAAAWAPPAVATAVAWIVGASAAGHAVVFLAVGWRRFGDPWHLPQWVLFLPMAASAIAAPQLRSSASVTSGAIATWAGGAAVLLLLAIAGLHVAWACGSSLPCASRERLALVVVGRAAQRGMPGRVATWAVAIALVAAAGCTAALAGFVDDPLPRGGLALGGLTLVAVFGLRALGGYFEVVLRPEIRGTPYLRYSRWVYSPLAGLLAVLIGLAMSR